MDLLPAEEFGALGLFPVGRLDRHTTGALLLTNDGDLAHRLMHPSYGVTKQYLVQTKNPVTEDQLADLKTGVVLEDGEAKADKVSYLEGDQQALIMAIHEGRNRQVRRMIEAQGNEVTKLDRVLYAGLSTKGVRKRKMAPAFQKGSLHPVSPSKALIHPKTQRSHAAYGRPPQQSQVSWRRIDL